MSKNVPKEKPGKEESFVSRVFVVSPVEVEVPTINLHDELRSATAVPERLDESV